MIDNCSTAYESSSDGNCKFSDIVANVPDHILTAQPVATAHQVCIVMLIMDVSPVHLILDIQRVPSKSTKIRT